MASFHLVDAGGSVLSAAAAPSPSCSALLPGGCGPLGALAGACPAADRRRRTGWSPANRSRLGPLDAGRLVKARADATIARRKAEGDRFVASRRWPTASPRRPAPTSSSTRTTRSTGTRGAPRRCERARAEDRPILLSIGYSSCHWCHVMERESFEDAETAAFMNEHFVPVKVDREERPDVDAIYMEAVQGMTGHGGWPLTAFCDSGRRPVLRRHLLPARAAPRACRASAW